MQLGAIARRGICCLLLTDFILRSASPRVLSTDTVAKQQAEEEGEEEEEASQAKGDAAPMASKTKNKAEEKNSGAAGTSPVPAVRSTGGGEFVDQKGKRSKKGKGEDEESGVKTGAAMIGEAVAVDQDGETDARKM